MAEGSDIARKPYLLWNDSGSHPSQTGCNRGTYQEEIEAVITENLAELKFSIESVKAICTIELKKDEAGLLEVANKYGWEFIWFTADQLNTVKLTQPSDTVKKFTGAYGVSEPAAKLYSGANEHALVKKKSGNVTISVAVIPSGSGVEKGLEK